ncbi:MAG: methyltransferase domain-containing protein [Desulfobaccales bacterium]
MSAADFPFVDLTPDQRRRVLGSLREKYVRVASCPAGLFRYPTGPDGLKALGYPEDFLASLPESVAVSFCGVGNPFTLGPLVPGEAVVDIGCGAGVDALLAARLVGPGGRVVGLDVVAEMALRAREHARATGVAQALFLVAGAENLPFPDQRFEVALSNGAFNLVVDKGRALAEVFRVLKPGGRFLLADEVLVGELPADLESRLARWAR